jgi:diaminohydroxyphosphoribosylaminopyrimidine deaminase/5-amino-6-(5-phosphoribosylamino)uracil reductase
VYIAPVLLGPQARPMMQLQQIERLADRVQFRLHSHAALGGDVKLVLRPPGPGKAASL